MFLTKIFYIAVYMAVVYAQRDSSSTNTAADGSSDTTLSPDAIQSGSFVDGSQQIGAAEAGQALSSTSQNNFINNCAGKVLTNGLQITSGSCNGITMGDIPAKSAMVSSTIIFPKTGKTIPSDTTFQIQVQMANIVAGSFTNADATYYAAPQTLSGGLVVGHTHVTVQDMGNSLNPTNALDPTQFAFFKGINDAGNGNGLLSANVTGGLPAGNYRVCTMASASNHQPVLMPVAQRGTADDCTKFVVTGDGNTPNAASNDGSGGQAAAAAAASAVAAGPGAIESDAGNAATPTTKSGGRKSKITPSPSASTGNTSNGNTSDGNTSDGNTNNGNTSNGNNSDGTSTGFGGTNQGSSGSGFQQDGTDTGSDSFLGQDFSDEQASSGNRRKRRFIS